MEMEKDIVMRTAMALPRIGLAFGIAVGLFAGCVSAGYGPPAAPGEEGKAAPAPAAAGSAAAAPASPAPSPAAALRPIGEAIDRGTNWLLTRQNPDGGYGPSIGVKDSSDVGLTAFVLYALARSPRGYKEHDGPYISRAVEFLTGRQQASGAIFDPKDPSLQNYKTSVAILALLAVDRVKHAPVIQKAVEFVKSEQFSEAKGYVKESHVGFGGIGYGGDPGRPDLSNSQFAAEALHQAGVSGADDLWVRLQVFLSRCQNGETVDPLVKAAGVGTSKDGGFRYQPAGTRGNTESLDGDKIYSSYGSMTYAGLKSMLYANLTKEDPRVQAAFKWIQGSFSVKENPGMATASDPSKGQQGLFYYYHTMAKALAAYGEPVLVDAKGVKHIWAKELGEEIASLQHPQGFWDNPAERWLEGIEVLDTSYAIVSLTIAREELQKFLESPEGKAGAPGSR